MLSLILLVNLCNITLETLFSKPVWLLSKTCFTSNAIVGETSLDRLANALGGKVVLPHIIRNITSMLRSGMCVHTCMCGQEGEGGGGREMERRGREGRRGRRGVVEWRGLLIELCVSATEDWHCRHAMLMAISAVGEGCEKQVQPILGDVVQAVLPYCQDQVSESQL